MIHFSESKCSIEIDWDSNALSKFVYRDDNYNPYIEMPFETI